ncbi:MAG: hypothetical protein KIT33_01585 [Candidatus Kapabacteria bacterium]|nr:hypothetical protein [Ignavibacteriota bacterium]MCW5883642.1 hypothetical protein [Candidatus Kapabacteria bacterium]
MEEMYNDGFTSEDIEQNKVMSLLAYIIFFIPLLAAKDSKFARYHANQGLVLLLLGISISLVSSIIPIIGWFIIGPLGTIFVIVLAVMGIINALNGKAKPLPLIGGISLIK